MKQCAFTIVAKNYIGLGVILGKSIKRHNPNIDFKIFVADEQNGEISDIPSDVLFAKQHLKQITESEWIDMAFKYDLTEFCTSIKPFCIDYLFLQQYDKVYYFDPDIFVFSPLTDIEEALDAHSMCLTPQVCGIHIDYKGEHPEWAMNVNGIFNLGFCGIKNDEYGRMITKWWMQRLRDNAFADRSVGNFTDQKWMDWVPALLGDKLYVLRSLGMNMAPWNYFERKIYKDKNGDFRVSNRFDDMFAFDDRLVFIHFAGYDYSKLKKGIISRKRIESLSEYDDIKEVNNIYMQSMVEYASIFDKYINQEYSYSKYDNGDSIASFHRRLYHGLSFEEKIENPFSTTKGSFYSKIKAKGMIIDANIDGVSRRSMSDLNQKKKMLSMFYKVLYRLIGYKRYVMFLKSLYFYCRPEMHSFIVKK